MKYSEFKTEVEKLGFFVDMDNAPLYIDKAKGGETLIAIGKHKRFSVDPGWSGFHSLSENEQLAIYNLAHALAITPLADREEEKRYRVKFPGITRDGKNIYLMRQSNRDGTHGIDWSPEEYIFDDFPDGYLFTEKEIKAIHEAYWKFAEEVME